MRLKRLDLPPRRWVLTAAAAMAALAWLAWPAAAQEEAAPPTGPNQAADAGSTSALPLNKVVLFTSGVGFFQRTAQIEGDAQVSLQFNVEDINDLLKSMVLEDLDGGRISTVTYASQDPITKTLETFAIDLTSNPTLAQLLNQIRGERVQIEAPNRITGVILGVETRQEKVGDQVVGVEMLNLLADEGLRSVPLAGVGRIQLEKPELDAELRQALAVLAMGHSTDQKAVTLNFLGEGSRSVRVGYIRESPIWKTSYRLVIREEAPPLLQGWAIVENTTEEDWEGIHLTLVSGRPISFVMDLYQPLYVPRPEVELELFASLRPRVYGQDLGGREAEFKAAAEGAAGRLGELARGRRLGRRAEQPKEAADEAQLESAPSAMMGFDPGASVTSMAQAAEVGELFQYTIDTPVTLPRRQSAMLPIVNGTVQGEKLSIYNPSVQAVHPLNGLRLTNSSGLHLMQGPITVFDGGAYAGDAQIEDLPPGSERLISYALDLEIEAAVEARPSPQRLTRCRLVKGVLHTQRKYLRGQDYTLKNSGDEARKVLVEYPLDASWKLVKPDKPAEKTRELYRFAVTAEPGKPARLTVEEEQTVSEQIALSNLDDAAIRTFMESQAVSQEIKAALAEVVSRKRAIEKVVLDKQHAHEQLAAIDQEQARIRQNMERLDRTTDLYNRYVQKFGDQEDEVERLRDRVEKLSAEESRLRQSLDDYLVNLEIS